MENKFGILLGLSLVDKYETVNQEIHIKWSKFIFCTGRDPPICILELSLVRLKICK